MVDPLAGISAVLGPDAGSMAVPGRALPGCSKLTGDAESKL